MFERIAGARGLEAYAGDVVPMVPVPAPDSETAK